MPALPLDVKAAAVAVEAFNRLHLPDVHGQPELREAAGDWQRDIVRAVFGSLDDSGRRRVAEVFNLVPKKNNKTTGGAAIMLTALLVNKRPRAEFLLVGPTQEIADLAFQQAVGMIEADDYLKLRFKVRDHVKTIRDDLKFLDEERNKPNPSYGSFLKIKTFDMKVATGSKPVGILIDELHLMSSMHFAARVIGQLRGGVVANPEAFLIFITTQSDEAPAGVFKQELDYARGVRDGRITEGVRMLPLLYEFPVDIQEDRRQLWANPKLWPMVMPNLGRSITLEALIPKFHEAREKGEGELKRWASQHLNIQIGTSIGSDSWAGAQYWDGAADESLTLERLIEISDCVVAGIDGGGLDDLYGLALIGRHKVTREWLLWTKAWCWPDVLERRKEIAERLRDFDRDGDLVICDEILPSERFPTETDEARRVAVVVRGDDPHLAPQDIREIAAIIEQVRDAGLLPEKAGVGLDPVGVAAMVDELAARQIEGDQVVAVTQGYRLSGAVWGLERKLKDGTFWHSGSRMMAWCVGNAKVEQRGNAVLITKQAAGKAKIDPLVAAFDAAMLMSRNPEAVGRFDLNEWLANPVTV